MDAVLLEKSKVTLLLIWQQNQLSPHPSRLNHHPSPHHLNPPVVFPVLAVMNCWGRSLVFAVRGAAHQSGGLLCGSGRDYWAFRRLHTVSHSPSDQRGTRLSPHLTPWARDFTGISTQSCLISPSTLFPLMAISNMNAHTHTHTGTHTLVHRHMVKCTDNEIKWLSEHTINKVRTIVSKQFSKATVQGMMLTWFILNSVLWSVAWNIKWK